MLIIFDCDGVLVDTETLGAEVLQECLRERGIELEVASIFRDFRGKSIATCVAQVKRLMEERKISSDPALLEHEAENFWRHVQQKTLEAFEEGVASIAGIDKVLHTLKTQGVECVVASNGRHEKMRTTLGKTGLLPLFAERMFSATDVAAGKPAPDLFLFAARRMGCPPGDCIVVEDSLSGARAARAAGMGLVAYCPENDPEIDAGMREQGARIIRHMDALVPTLCEHYALPINMGDSGDP